MVYLFEDARDFDAKFDESYIKRRMIRAHIYYHHVLHLLLHYYSSSSSTTATQAIHLLRLLQIELFPDGFDIPAAFVYTGVMAF